LEQKPPPKKGLSCTTQGCLVVLGVVVILSLIGYFFGSSPRPSRTSSPKPVPSAKQPAATGTQAFTLSDGSQLTVENVQPTSDWACGTRKTGTIALPNSQTAVVMLYFDRKGQIFSINIPQAGNERIYDNSQGRECLMNWKTNQMELLTEEEYKRFEKEAGKQ
jgi:hypothetical protein